MAIAEETRNLAAVDAAIDQVLAAEREARAAVASCRAEGDRILAAAEEKARRIDQRTEARIARAHRTADRAVEKALAALERPAPGAGFEPPRVRVQWVVERALDGLIDEILGGGP